MGHLKKKSKKKLVLDKFHYHEAIDRTYMVGYIGELFLIKHPVFIKHKKIKKKVKKALDILADVYQELNSVDLKKFNH